MKRRIAAVAVLMIFTAMLAWGTVAYFTAEERAVNVLTIGSVNIAIDEYDQEGDKVMPGVTPESWKNIEPGQRIIKQVMIKNRGEDTAWIRAKIIDSITASDELGGGALSKDVLMYNINQLYKPGQTVAGTWTLGDDGYYYFSAPLEAGEVAVLFDVVSFDGPSMGNEYQGCITRIQVLAQAVQYEGNEGTADHPGADPESWPAEPSRVGIDEQNEAEGLVHDFYKPQPEGERPDPDNSATGGERP